MQGSAWMALQGANLFLQAVKSRHIGWEALGRRAPSRVRDAEGGSEGAGTALRPHSGAQGLPERERSPEQPDPKAGAARRPEGHAQSILRTHSKVWAAALMLALLWSAACKKPGTDVRFSLSRDLVVFDTTFAQIGTSTEVVIIRNLGSAPLRFDRVYLAGGSASRFRLNVDGSPGPVVTDLEIAAKDSAYLFVEATIDPHGHGDLLAVDSVIFEPRGGTPRALPLLAQGADAVYIWPTDTLVFMYSKLPYSILPCGGQWTSAKPVVVVGWAVVDSACTFTLTEGARVHFWKDAGLWVYRGGTLKALGQTNNYVLLTSYRLGIQHQDRPGQWDRVLFHEGSVDNELRNVKIFNGFIGIQAEPAGLNDLNLPRKLTLQNVEITNMSGAGILARDYHIEGYNVVVSDCGSYGAALTFGGTYRFYHSTFANFWRFGTRKNPTVFCANYTPDIYDVDPTSDYIARPIDVRLANCIIAGNMEQEFGLDSLPSVTTQFVADRCMLKVRSNFSMSATRFPDCIRQADPGFVGPEWNDYTLKENAPARNIAKPDYMQQWPQQLEKDFRGNPRNIDLGPDLGAYEY
ncbi:MAG: right-handed parallel beta-helix repeat-containing protein [Flavobacteriales bacterium]|nr:right-handed parallel beta-helix repeat-containing protein [Flavobacteriales bacterium]MDW8432556.1 right-handed parallel beta-helix repeat-containing protein [Flavobacteriales bacterium]